MKRILLLSFALLTFISYGVMAQRTVSGKVTDDAGEGLPGVNVVIKGTTTGVSTDLDGNYRISVEDGATLVFSYVGFETQEVQVGARSTIDVVLGGATELQEVVVTGVAAGTSTKKLGFAVGKVSGDQLKEVPATDAGNALRGKVAGVRVVKPSGNPAIAPEIRLRGSTSISGNQRPLIIIDGIITDGNLNDINMEDVESIEVIKGAAASSLYGSLAGNGVVQIITKRGVKSDKPRITLKQESGVSTLIADYPTANTHPYANDPLGVRMGDWNGDGEETSNFGFDLETNSGLRTLDEDRRWDNPYLSETYDNVENTLTDQPFHNTYVSMEAAGDQFRYLVSFNNLVQGGIVEPIPSYKRRNFRVNFDYAPDDKWNIRVSSLYSTTDGVNVTEQGQGRNLFFGLLTAEPFIDLTQKNEDGEFDEAPDGYEVQASNFQNPLYVGGALDWGFKRKRLIGGLTVSYNITPDLAVEAQRSVDYTNDFNFFIEPTDYRNPDPTANRNGRQFESYTETQTEVSSAQLRWSKSFSDINLAATVKYLLEERNFRFTTASGNTFTTAGVRNLGAVSQDIVVNSYQQEEIAENIFFDVSADYQDKIIVNGLIRRDGSSNFGSDQRYQTFGRGSVAYRITEDFTIPGINELKVRGSYGIAGQRPPFVAQYETLDPNNTGITKQQLGNTDLKPSKVKEFEAGINVDFLNRFSFEANYAVTNVADDYIQAPLGAKGGGFTSQWLNIGETKSTALEFSLSGTAYERNGLRVDFAVNWDKITQEITSLGVADFTRNTNTAFDLFRVEEGLPYGTMYGNLVLTSASQLVTDESGNVLMAALGSHPLAGEGLTVDDFIINSDGYLVVGEIADTDDTGAVIMTTDTNGDGVYDPADGDIAQRTSSLGTEWEQALYLTDELGEKASTQIGNTNPDWNLGFSTTISFKGLSLYVLVDHQNGGDIYNYTKQLLYFNDRHKDLEDYGRQGKHINYSNGASQIYNAASASSHFVEDGTFTKVREISLAYTFNKDQLGSLGNTINRIKIQASGRNLFTFTDYTGWDPEVAINNNPTNFRIDEYAYPNFRTYTGTLTINF